MLRKINIAHLNQLKSLINNLSVEDYISSDTLLSGSSIGQHFRHIIEFYLTMLEGAVQGEISYDDRKRDLKIENEVEFAIQKINFIINEIEAIDSSKQIKLKANYSADFPNQILLIETSLKRELAYALDHMIHHLAIIKIALFKRGVEVSENIGVAPSTIRHKSNVCAQ